MEAERSRPRKAGVGFLRDPRVEVVRERVSAIRLHTSCTGVAVISLEQFAKFKCELRCVLPESRWVILAVWSLLADLVRIVHAALGHVLERGPVDLPAL